MAINEGMMSPEVENKWNDLAGRVLKAELKRANVTYEELANKLSSLGLEETKASIASKLSRGTYSAAFLFASLRAIGKHSMNLEDS